MARARKTERTWQTSREGGSEADADRSFPIVGVGASAGGIPALQRFFPGVPHDSGFAFVVNGKSSTTTLKQNVDMLAATVNGCY